MKRRMRGFSFIELPIVVAIITAFTAIVTMASSVALKHARETAALKHVVTLMNAETWFYAVTRRYAGALEELGPDKAKLIPETLASGRLGGYLFDISGNEDGFTVRATPERQANYYADETLVIPTNDAGAADGESPPLK